MVYIKYMNTLIEAIKELKKESLTNEEIENLISHRIHGTFKEKETIRYHFLGDYFDSIMDFWGDISWFPHGEITVSRKVYNLLTKCIDFIEKNPQPEPYFTIYVLWLIENEYVSFNEGCKMFQGQEPKIQQNSENYINEVFEKIKSTSSIEDINYLIGQCLKTDPNINPKKLRDIALKKG